MFIAVIVLVIVLGVFLSYNASPSNTQNTSPSKKVSTRYPLVYLDDWDSPQKPVDSFNENKGKSESYFLKYLQKYFPKHIHTDLALQIDEAYYYPDFTFFSKKHNLYLDIEIDEPYNFKGKPTHIIGSDDSRNLFFMEASWVVIRFTEEQVVRQPVQCCKFIADTIFKLTKDKTFQDNLKGIQPLTILPSPWTAQQAQQMAANRVRDSYTDILN